MNDAPVSVVIPTRLGVNPATGVLFLERALASIAAQTHLPKQIVVAMDEGVRIGPLEPASFNRAAAGPVPLMFVNQANQGHAGATNAGVRASESLYIAILEDDDTWHPRRLETCLEAMDLGAAFVSCSQQEWQNGTSTTDANTGAKMGMNDFPTPSGWLFRRLDWIQLGGFDRRFRVHQDNEFLGKLSAAGMSRIHIAEKGADVTDPKRSWLAHVSKFARIMHWGEPMALVNRYNHNDSVMSRSAAEKGERSAKEYAALEVLYGFLPW